MSEQVQPSVRACKRFESSRSRFSIPQTRRGCHGHTDWAASREYAPVPIAAVMLCEDENDRVVQAAPKMQAKGMRDGDETTLADEANDPDQLSERSSAFQTP